MTLDEAALYMPKTKRRFTSSQLAFNFKYVGN